MSVVNLGLRKLPALFLGGGGADYAGAEDNSTNTTSTPAPTEIDYAAIDTSTKSQLSDSSRLIIFFVVAGIAAAVVIALLVFTFVTHTLSNRKMNEAQKQNQMVRLIKKRAAQRASTHPDARVHNFNYIPATARPKEEYFGKEEIPPLNDENFQREISFMRSVAGSGGSALPKGGFTTKSHNNFSMGSSVGLGLGSPTRSIVGTMDDRQASMGASPMQIAAREARAQQQAAGDAFAIGAGRGGGTAVNPLSPGKIRAPREVSIGGGDGDYKDIDT